MKKKIIIAVVSLCGALSLASAQSSSMGFLNVNPDAAVAAMAGAGVGLQADAYAIDNNIAAAALSSSRMDIEAGYGIWQPNASKADIISAAGFCRIGEKFALAASFKNFTEQEYFITSSTGRQSSTFTPKEMSVALGASFRVSKNFALGVDAKYAVSTIAESAKASTVAFDVAASFSKNGLTAGLSVCNLGGKVNYGGSSSYSLPTVARLGASYSTAFGLNAGAEFDYAFSGGLMCGAGVEYWIKEIIALRAGYHYGGQEVIPSYASLGLGADIKGVKLNFAYLLASDTIGGSLMLTLGYAF